MRARPTLARATQRAERAASRRRLARHPVPLIVHCAHHKMGTVWFLNVLTSVSQHFGLTLEEVPDGNEPRLDTGVALYHHAAGAPTAMLDRPDIRGSHLIRDPRDAVVSGYFYHRRTHESWVHQPLAELDGRTYQEHLLAVPQEVGMRAEIERFAGSTLLGMTAWDYHRPTMLELRYEDVLADEPAAFARLFEWYGFTGGQVRRCVDLALSHSLAGRTASDNQHVRSGRPGDWRDHLSPANLALFDSLAGSAVVELGYADPPASG